MAKQAYLGNRIRRLRKESGWTQVELARRLEISASYLNLIERNQRALTVPLLLKLADIFQLDLKTFADDDEAQLVAELRETFTDPVFSERAIRDPDIRDLLANTPIVARAILDLYRQYRTCREEAQEATARLSDGEKLFGPGHARIPSEDVSDVIQERTNYFPEVEGAAEALCREARIDETPGGHFQQLASYLTDRFGTRVQVVPADALEGAVRRYHARDNQLMLSEALPAASLTFQLAHQTGLLYAADVFERIVESASFTTEESRRLMRVALANYFAGAVLMPYDRLLDSARAFRWDVELLEHRFRTSFEQVCHRLTTLNRPDNPGIPFHLVRIDIAGNISKRFSGSGIPFARYSGACPLWNVHTAFLTPGLIRTQTSELPDGSRYFSIARTVRKSPGGHRPGPIRLAIELGCPIQHASEMVYADGVDLEGVNAAVPVGISCRMCERMDCRQRAFPPMHHPLEVNENVRGLSFYASPGRAAGRPGA